MATVVLVHGIAQEQKSADTLEVDWIPAVAGGVRTAGHPTVADRLRRSANPIIDVRMAFYGDLFISPGAQGAGGTNGDLDGVALDLAESLAIEILENAAGRASDLRDKFEAQRQLDILRDPPAQAQGAAAAMRPALNALASLRWFAPIAVGVAGRSVWRAVAQVTRYLTDPEIRTSAQDRILAHIAADTRVVVAHSLGSVVAYEALRRADRPVALVTLGSPLGLRNVVYERLTQPVNVPAAVTGWHNVVDVDDLVAARIDLAPLFPAAPGRTVAPITLPPVDNGSAPHSVSNYLTKMSVGRIIGDILAG